RVRRGSGAKPRGGRVTPSGGSPTWQRCLTDDLPPLYGRAAVADNGTGSPTVGRAMAKLRSRRRIENFALFGLLAVVLTAVGMTLRYVHGYWRDLEVCRQLRDLGAHVSERYE